MEWLTYAKNALSLKEGTFAADEKGRSFLLECKKVDILSPGLAEFKRELSEVAAQKLSESELSFLKANPEAASSEIFLQACKPLLEGKIENADWDSIKETIKSSVKQFYLADLSKFGPEAHKPILNDVFFCATIKSSDEKETLGFLLFSITPALPFGDVKVINFFITNEKQSPELQPILMSLVFKILPQSRRIFLFARPTDLSALQMYASMGFEKDKNPFHDPSHKINNQYLTSLEYRIENSNLLQRAAEQMKAPQGVIAAG